MAGTRGVVRYVTLRDSGKIVRRHFGMGFAILTRPETRPILACLLTGLLALAVLNQGEQP